MNKRQKEILQNELNNEKTVLNQINAVYQRAIADIESKIEKMQARKNLAKPKRYGGDISKTISRSA